MLPPNDDHILRLAFDAFAERGYDGATVRDLAQVLGVSHGFINARFGTKEALWRLAVQHEIRGQPQMILATLHGDQPDDVARLRQLVVSWTRMAAAKPGIARLINEEARHDTPRLEYLYRELIAPFAASLGELLDRAAKLRGVPTPDKNIFMHLLVDGISRYFGLWPLLRHSGAEVPRTPEEIQAHGELFADLLLASFDCGDRGPVRGRTNSRGGQPGSSRADGADRT